MSVWVLFELANRPEYIPMLREEMEDLIQDAENVSLGGTFTFEGLRKAKRADSFIREVMRTKGDTLNACRETTEDVIIGGYIIPKGTFSLRAYRASS